MSTDKHSKLKKDYYDNLIEISSFLINIKSISQLITPKEFNSENGSFKVNINK